MMSRIEPRRAAWRWADRRRAFDVIVAVVGIVCLAPLLAVAAVAIRLGSNGPVVFQQPRVGLDGRVFTIYKFRTMYVDNDDSAHRAANLLEIAGLAPERDGVSFKDQADPRITAVGRFLRRYSIDELPQLVNVVKGDMALVGPRPSLIWEAEEFPQWALRRFHVRPGITGVWQVEGRNNVSMAEMLEMDCDYVRNRSFVGDLRLLARTVPAVFDAEGAA